MSIFSFDSSRWYFGEGPPTLNSTSGRRFFFLFILKMASRAQEVSLLGLCDGEIDSKKHRCSYLTNKVGGRPDWPPGIAARSPRCGRCRVPLVHVVQVYCPVDTSPHHRNLHVFACPGAECSGRSECWAVLRSQCLEAEVRTPGPPAPAQEAPMRVTDWCDTADDWGMGGEEDNDGWGGGAKQNTPVKEGTGAPEAAGRAGQCCIFKSKI